MTSSGNLLLARAGAALADLAAGAVVTCACGLNSWSAKCTTALQTVLEGVRVLMAAQHQTSSTQEAARGAHHRCTGRWRRPSSRPGQRTGMSCTRSPCRRRSWDLPQAHQGKAAQQELPRACFRLNFHPQSSLYGEFLGHSVSTLVQRQGSVTKLTAGGVSMPHLPTTRHQAPV